MTNIIQLKRKLVSSRVRGSAAGAKEGLSLIRAFRQIKSKADRRAVIALAKKLADKSK